jgi:hypothetical protein
MDAVEVLIRGIEAGNSFAQGGDGQKGISEIQILLAIKI